MSDPTAICVYCGSSDGDDSIYRDQARAFGTLLAQNHIRLVYGGGGHGLMGAVARGVMEAGGEVIGIIPHFLEQREHMLTSITDLQVVPDMHERKLRMMRAADAFVVLPGGIGTLEELFEVLTWKQLDLHDKPIVIANIAGYWDPLLATLDQIMARRFAAATVRDLYGVAPTLADILPTIRSAAAPSHGDRPNLI